MAQITATVTVILVITHALCQPNSVLTQIGNFTSLNLTEARILGTIRDKCIANGGGEEAFEVLKVQPFELNACLQHHMNYTQIQEELEESKKTGSMDEVFEKYCEKYPQMYTCVEAVSSNLAPCLDHHEQYSINRTLDFMIVVKEFLCSKSGDNMAMFVAKGGVECMQSSYQDLQYCFDLAFTSTEKECDDLHQVRVCFFEILQKCEESIPANVVEAFFKTLKTGLACNDTSVEYSTKNWDNGDNLLRLLVGGLGLVIIVIIIYELLTCQYTFLKTVVL